jgi:hypothetical protein
MINGLLEASIPQDFREFIDPSELKAVYKSESLTGLFGGFSTEGR